jgi:flagellin-like hook-associated protein FlgL
MSTPSIDTGTYLASVLGLGSLAASNSVVTETQSDSPPPTESTASTLSSEESYYLLLTDTLDSWSAMVSLVQVNADDLAKTGEYLTRIRDVYQGMSEMIAGSQEFSEQAQVAVGLERELSIFLAQKMTSTPDVELAYSKEGAFQEAYFRSIDLSSIDGSLQGSTLASLEVDMSDFLLNIHDPASCPICAQGAQSDSFSDEIDPSGATPYDAAATNTSNVTGSSTSSASGDSNIETLRMGPIWDLSAGETLSYSYYDGSVAYTGYPAGGRDPTSAGLASLLPAHETNLDAAYDAWDLVAEFDFEKVTESGTTVGEMRNAYTSVAPAGVAAYAYNPGSGVVNGDVWFVSTVATNSDFTPGGYGYMTALHEIGHALGLSHPFDGGSATGATLPGSTDFMRNTLMSYTSVDRNFYLYNTGSGVGMQGLYASTPMVYDIASIEYLYGDVTDANLGDTTYSWSDTPKIIETITDSGGTDTIDASNQTKASIIDLTPGAFSSIGLWTEADQITYWSGATGVTTGALTTWIATQNATVSAPSGVKLYTGEDNVAIAQSATIENAYGGAGDDQITGNTADNTLKGNQGDDTIDGGAGTDTAIFSGNFSDYTITTTGGTTTVQANSGTDGTDTLTNVEYLQFADVTYNIASSGVTSNSGGGGSSSVSPAGRLANPHAVSGGNIQTVAAARKFMEVLDNALAMINAQRSALGAIHNRLEAAASQMATQKVNTMAVRSNIVDTDYVAETAALARAQIIQVAGRSVLKRALTNPEYILRLLRT